jgi:hypothetical protein
LDPPIKKRRKRWASALCLFLFRAFGDVTPEEDYGNEKNDYEYIFDAIGLEEIHIPVEIAHHRTSLLFVLVVTIAEFDLPLRV